jgi:DNA-binding transcriptional regulator YiaG
MTVGWQHQRTMTPEEYEWALERLDLNKAEAGRLLGRSERTSRRYISGDASIPAAEVLLLRALIHHGEVPVVPRWNRRQN